MANAGARILASDTGRHYCFVHAGTTGQSIPTGLVFTSVLMQSEQADPDNMHDPVTNNSRVVIGTTLGWWSVSGTVAFTGAASIAAGETRRAAIFLNGAAVNQGAQVITPYFTGTSGLCSVVIPPVVVQAVAITDYVELMAAHDHGSAVTLTVSAGFRPQLAAVWLGP